MRTRFYAFVKHGSAHIILVLGQFATRPRKQVGAVREYDAIFSEIR